MNHSRYLFLVMAFLLQTSAWSHPMPNSVLLMDIKGNGVAAELQWPLKELQLAFPNETIDTNVNTLLQRKGAWLDAYLQQHMQVTGIDGKPWIVKIKERAITTTAQSYTGKFNELIYKLWLQPPPGSSTRHFIVHYDAIMHQVVTHRMLISIRQDWDGGLTAKDSTNAELVTLMMDLQDNKVPPLIINLDEGSRWKGFKSMVSLGIDHIAGGTDHLLFLLVLLLPAPVIAAGGRWGRSGGTRYSIICLVKITTAFTIGHSLTLIAGAIGWVHFPAQPVEILIAVSILIGAIHALRPLFPGREAFVAAGFGLVHGLAFATTLANLYLDSGRTALSILGFNIGIELMQLFVILITVPWLILLSGYKLYKWVRIGGALLTAIAAIAWLAERVTGHTNPVAKQLDVLSKHGNYLVLVLAVMALCCYFIMGKKPQLYATIERW